MARNPKGSILGKKEYYGVYRAKVEDNKDPQGVGRVRVRIPSMHGIPGIDKSYIGTEDLPWAQYGASVEGTYLVPDEGSMVFIMFEAGDSTKPIYIGGCYSNNSNLAKVRATTDSTGTHQWNSSSEINNVPIEATNLQHTHNAKVVYQSPKGAAIVVNEDTGNESIKIIDRLGQSIEMISPLDDPSDAVTRRNSSGVVHSKGNGIHTNKTSGIRLVDSAGQVFQMMNEGNGENSSVLISNAEGDYNLTVGYDGILVEGSQGYSVAVVDDEVRISNVTEEKYVSVNEEGIKVDNGEQTILMKNDSQSILLNNTNASLEVRVDEVEINSNGCKLIIRDGRILVYDGKFVVNGDLQVNGDIIAQEVDN